MPDLEKVHSVTMMSILSLKDCKVRAWSFFDPLLKESEGLKIHAINPYDVAKLVRVGHHCSGRWFGRDRCCVGR
jgi:hypothetical protein